MGTMDVSPHPPLFLAPRPGERIVGKGMTLAHAAVWSHVEVPQWRESWEIHLQLVGLEGGTGWRWRAVDLTGRPLSPSPCGGLGRPGRLNLPASARAGLIRWLQGYRIQVFRSPQTGLVSRPDEEAGEFRRRVLAAAQPLVLAAKDAGGARLAETAEILQRMASDLERRELDLTQGRHVRVRAGFLVVPSVDSLRPAGPAPDPMLSGEARKG